MCIVQKLYCADHLLQIHGEVQGTAITRLEDLPSQSRRRHCVDGPVRGPDGVIPAAVRFSDSTTLPSRAAVVECDRPSECGMDCPATHRGLRLARCTSLSQPASGNHTSAERCKSNRRDAIVHDELSETPRVKRDNQVSVPLAVPLTQAQPRIQFCLLPLLGSTQTQMHQRTRVSHCGLRASLCSAQFTVTPVARTILLQLATSDSK